ncbi:murein L,D-transpeptidase catalytic domain family protein [Legionella quinlivanii]|uniref:murein L,D-transpeptidase catalytic domain family protein n=1 Tax=Legionella quinlivanii TaxID=45073 RepID=UPI0022446707|nr:murein L,D-transpeptidase catalytic domain family protein [Legionella quinlivanii]MCW8450410.1 murein L,D-transpeptidase catalytic domain family protein [Legionella quinlivanii]
MRTIILLMLAVTSSSFSLPSPVLHSQNQIEQTVFEDIISLINPEVDFPPPPSLGEIQKMLKEQAPDLRPEVVSKVLTTLRCTREFKLPYNKNILTVIDYSLPSSEKRFWVFDLSQQRLLFHTYVSHGITSGSLNTNYFSNKYNSKASSIGVYTTDQAYYGREGLSLRLDGLDRGFNDNASNRAVVMHGGWYMAEDFIKKYGRPGRSWGCPALPMDKTVPIINTIKNKSLFVIYYPSDSWFVRSKFLNCSRFNLAKQAKSELEIKPAEEEREAILFVDNNKNSSRQEEEPIAVIDADNYVRIFKTKAPLERMLRRQINHMEYIALSNAEFNSLISNKDKILNVNNDLEEVSFVIPVIKMVRGYYETEMHVVPLGKIKSVEVNSDPSRTDAQAKSYTVHFDNKTVNLRPSNQFIRWLGL